MQGMDQIWLNSHPYSHISESKNVTSLTVLRYDITYHVMICYDMLCHDM